MMQTKRLTTILFVIFLASTISVHSEIFQNFEISLTYTSGDLAVKSLHVRILETQSEQVGPYSAEAKSFENKTLNVTEFLIPNRIIFDTFDPDTGEIIGGYTEILNKTEFIVYVPYFSNAKEIILYNSNGTEKLRIDVSMFAEEIPIIEEKPPEEIKELVEEDVEKEEIKKLSKQILISTLLGIGVILLLILIIVFLKRRFKKEKQVLA